MDIQFDNLINYSRNEYVKRLILLRHTPYVRIINSPNSYTNKFSTFFALISPAVNHMMNLVNPYYIGMGNPFCVSGSNQIILSQSESGNESSEVLTMPNDLDTSILFIGQELGFNPVISKARLFFEEQLSHHDLLKRPDLSFFNPYRPNDYRRVTRHSHTWGIYSKFVASLLTGNSRNYDRYLKTDPHTGTRLECFENHCFFTELYDVPGAQHNADHLNPANRMSAERISFFQSKEFRSFLPRFRKIIIGDSGFYHNYAFLLNHLFGITAPSPAYTLSTGTKKCVILNASGQNIAISNFPLSSQWSYHFIDDICSKL